MGSSPQGVALVEVEQHVVEPELGLPRAVDLALRQVLVHLLQALQALGEVLVVDLGLERHHALLAQVVGAVHVEARALLDQRHRRGAAEVLLDDVLEEGRGGGGLDGQPVAMTTCVRTDWSTRFLFFFLQNRSLPENC